MSGKPMIGGVIRVYRDRFFGIVVRQNCDVYEIDTQRIHACPYLCSTSLFELPFCQTNKCRATMTGKYDWEVDENDLQSDSEYAKLKTDDEIDSGE